MAQGGIMRYEEETEEMRLGFEVWVGLGKGRTYKEVADLLGADDAAVGFWAKHFNWKDRLRELEEGKGEALDKREATGLLPLPVVDEESQGKLEQLSDMLRGMVDKGGENIRKAINDGLVLDVGDFMRLVKEYRETIVAHRRGNLSREKPATKADKVTVILNSLSQEDRIALFTGKPAHAIVPGGDKFSAAGCAEADYDEISDAGVEDGPGRDGVSGGVGRGEGGNESELQEGGGPTPARVSLLRFE